MGRVQDFDHDSVSCDNQCGKKVDAPSDTIPTGAWRQGEYDGQIYDVCSADCAQAIHLRASLGSSSTMEWWTAAGARVRTKV